MISFLFWVLWIMDLLLLLVAVLGKGFRDSFGAGTATNVWVMIVLIAALVGSLVLRYGMKKPMGALAVAAVPWIIMLIMYLADHKKL